MSSLIRFNRYYLKSIPDTALPACTGRFLFDLHRIAVKGSTSYLFDMSKYTQPSPQVKVEYSYTISLEEVIQDFGYKFSGCKVIYKD